MKRTPVRESLARQTGLTTSVLISTLILLAHVLFGWAQLSDTEQDCPGFFDENSTSAPTCPTTFKPGGLAEAQLKVHVGFDARGALSALLGGAEQLLCNSSCPGSGIDGVDAPAPAPAVATAHAGRLARGVAAAGLGGAADAVCDAMACDSCVNVAGLQTSQRCAADVSMVMLHMSYLYGVIHLWSQDASPDPHKPSGVYPARASAACLVVFSFIWPHVKLFLLHLAFFLPLSPSARRNLNYWLAFFGKWTLTDVLVMCSLVGMFNIHAEMSILQLWEEVEDDFVGLCTSLCAGNTSTLGANCTHLCEQAESALTSTLLNDGTLPSSDLAFAVSMRGLTSMYLFCCAVVLSLSLGVAIEFLDDRQRAAADAAADAAAGAAPLGFAPSVQAGLGGTARFLSATAEFGGGEAEAAAAAAAAAGGGAGGGGLAALWRRHERAGHTALVVTQLALTVAAFSSPLFRRVVDGALPAALRDRGFDFDGDVSMLQMVGLSAAAGGWDYLMATTYVVFCVACPVIRPLSLLLLLHAPLGSWRPPVHRLSRYVSYFYAIEVMLLAVPLMHDSFGPMSQSLVNRNNLPLCDTLAALYPNVPRDAVGDPLCFSIEVYADVGYWLAAAAVALFLLSGFDGSPTHKFVHREVEPDDVAPPEWAMYARAITRKCRRRSGAQRLRE